MNIERQLNVDIHLEANRAEGSLSIAISELFVDGKLRLWEYPDGWEGYILEDGAYYHVDTRLPDDEWPRKLRVGERAVRLAIRSHVADPAAGGVGRFERGCSA